MSHLMRRISVAGLLAAAIATVLTTGPAQADQTAPQVAISTTSVRAPLATNVHVVAFSQVQRKVAVAQIRKERAAARDVKTRSLGRPSRGGQLSHAMHVLHVGAAT